MREYGTPLIDAFAPSGAGGHRDSRSCLAPLPREAAGVAERCETVPGDFFESVPSGADAYLLKSILHDWDDEHSLVILKNCHRAMAGQGKLLVVERVLPERMQPSSEHRWMAASDLNMMVALAGRERKEAEFRALFGSAGFKLTRIVPAEAHYSVIEGVCSRA